MQASDGQIAHWDAVAGNAEFTLPIDSDRLRRFVGLDGQVLDYGCGYGRTLAQLAELGFRDLYGLDPSDAMLERARRRVPGADLRRCRTTPAPYPDASFDAVLLVAVLTCIPSDSDQRCLIDEIERLLRPGGLLFVCDFLLRDDERNTRRYAEHAGQHGVHGVFSLENGLSFRHHHPDRVRSLFRSFELLEFESFEARTMRGNPATGFRFAGRLPVSGAAV